VVGENLPGYLLPFASSGGTTPSVSIDFYLVGLAGNSTSQSFKQTLPNTLYDKETTQQHLHFPSQLHEDTHIDNHNISGTTGGFKNIKMAYGSGANQHLIFDYPHIDTANPLKTVGIDTPNQTPIDGFPVYQGNIIIKAGGHISWTRSYTAGSVSLARTTIKPIFSHNLKKIWKITLLYVS
jgi:hypothetical protein